MELYRVQRLLREVREGGVPVRPRRDLPAQVKLSRVMKVGDKRCEILFTLQYCSQTVESFGCR